jgi:hypothetical protein
LKKILGWTLKKDIQTKEPWLDTKRTFGQYYIEKDTDGHIKRTFGQNDTKNVDTWLDI